MKNRIRLLVSAVALIGIAILAAPADAVPRDHVRANDPLESASVAPSLPQLDRDGAGLACGRSGARCSIDFHDATHRSGRFCLRALRDGREIETCMEPGGYYGQQRADEVPEYRTARANFRPAVKFRCSTERQADRVRTTTCTLNLERAATSFHLRLFLNGRWQYAVRWWPGSGRLARVA